MIFLNFRSFLFIFSFRDQILKTRYWPIEVLKSSIPTGVKGKKVYIIINFFFAFPNLIIILINQ